MEPRFEPRSEQRFEWVVEGADQGKRLDLYVSALLPEVTRSRVQNLLAEGRVLVNQAQVKAGYKLKTGDRVEVMLPKARPLQVEPEKMDIPILYEDEDLAIVNKPRGIVVHPAAGHENGTLVNGLLYHFQGKLSGINGVMRPGIVHRIDKDTSGLLAICKSDRAHQGLSELLKEHDIRRVYHAVVHGNFKEAEGTVDAPIGRMDSDRKKMCIRKDGRRAVSHYRVLEQFDGYSYLAVQLETGRTHQIRVHMKSLGHPLLGDPMYGPAKETTSIEKKLKEMDFWPGQILHAKVLGFVHPVTKEYMEFDSELPEYFQQVLSLLRQKGCRP